MAAGEEEAIHWVGEIPLPTTNLQIQRTTYVLEQWLRRIALAALMAKGGSSWQGAFPAELLPDAKRSINVLRKRTYLDPENTENLIWVLAVEQLRMLLTQPELTPFVFALTGMSRSELASDIEKLRDIRNIVAHNRATNELAWDYLQAIERRLSAGIKRFQTAMISWDMVYDPTEDASSELYEFFAGSGMSTGRDYVLWRRGRFVEFRVGQDDPLRLHAPYFALAHVLDRVADLRGSVLAVVLPLDSLEEFQREFSVIWPVDVTHDEQEAIRDFALSLIPDSSVPYSRQNPKYVCDPIIWFDSGWASVTIAGE